VHMTMMIVKLIITLMLCVNSIHVYQVQPQSLQPPQMTTTLQLQKTSLQPQIHKNFKMERVFLLLQIYEI
jgi:hypothetical protein